VPAPPEESTLNNRQALLDAGLLPPQHLSSSRSKHSLPSGKQAHQCLKKPVGDCLVVLRVPPIQPSRRIPLRVITQQNRSLIEAHSHFFPYTDYCIRERLFLRKSARTIPFIWFGRFTHTELLFFHALRGSKACA
jgi:hypothetical protein